MSEFSVAMYFFWMFVWFSVGALFLSRFKTLANSFDLYPADVVSAAVSKPRDFHIQLEALRGFCAINVLFHHGLIGLFFARTGIWKIPPSKFYSLLGPYSVTLFFILSGYLFWSRNILSRQPIKVPKFYLARAKRLLPAYYALTVVIVLYVVIASDFHVTEPVKRLGSEMLSWLTVGIYANFQNINGVPTTLTACACAVWSLRMEAMFYLLLPAFARGNRYLMSAAVIVVFGLLDFYASRIQASNPSYPIGFAAEFGHFFSRGFTFGILAALIEPVILPRFSNVLRSRAVAVAACGLLVLIYVSNTEILSYFSSACLTGFFLIVLAKNDFGSLLSMPVSQFMGRISYCIYLFHGAVLFVTARAIENLGIHFAEFSSAQYWSYIGFCGFVTIGIASVVHLWIEKPFMMKKK